MGRSRGQVAPVQSSRTSNWLRKSAADISAPTATPVLNVIPSAAMRSILRWTTSLESFIVGMPYISRPPIRLLRSNTVTVWPALLS